MASGTNNQFSGGIPLEIEIATGTQEVIKRLKNTSHELEPSIIEQVLLDYMQELREGGYPIEVRTEMLQSCIKGYCKMWNLEVQGQGFVSGPGKATATKRRAKKLGQHNWFKSTGQQTTPNNNNVRPSKRKTSN